jgi:prolyl-tRNA synthetase
MASVLTSPGEDFPRWYQDVVAKAELAENGPVRGTMVIRPYGFAIWELVQAELDRRIKAAGAENAYFPLFIPESYLRREAEHVEGFSPELAVVTHGGGKQLEEPVVVRPTSETIINSFFSKWVQSYRDLPLLINQWANVVRWELRPRLFLRTTEFLWQEGHTAHATESDAHEYALQILRDVYESTLVDAMAIAPYPGRKTDRERFAGATTSWTNEGVMADGKALQMSTSHELGQNFARAFDIQFVNTEGERVHVWQTSWGASTRLMGALIMTHGDDAGLRLPPVIAPIQVVVLVVRDEGDAGARARALVDELVGAGVRARLDDRVDGSFGRRVVEWELKGVPVRVEVGPRDLAQGNVTVVRRDSREKAPTPVDGAARYVRDALVDAQAALLDGSRRLRDERTATVETLDEAEAAAQTGFARVPWSVVGLDGEARLNGKGVSVRCIQRADGSLPEPGDDERDLVALVARAY